MKALYQTEGRRVRYWCEDESRFGLKTITRRRITQRGVKPVGGVQWSFEAYYLYGTVDPLTGENFFMECSHLDTDCFQAYLNEFSKLYPNELHIIQLDNATCHTAKRLVIPDNIILWFQPAHSPDCNPVERVWAWFKDKLSWRLFDNLEQLKQSVTRILTQVPNDFLASLTGKHSLTKALGYFY